MIIRGILYLPTSQVKVTWASYFPNTQCLTWLLGVAQVSLSSCVLRESCGQHQVSLTRWSIRTLMNKEQAEKSPLFPPLRDTRAGWWGGRGTSKGDVLTKATEARKPLYPWGCKTPSPHRGIERMDLKCWIHTMSCGNLQTSHKCKNSEELQSIIWQWWDRDNLSDSMSWSRKWQDTSVFLAGKFRGHRSLTGWS